MLSADYLKMDPASKTQPSADTNTSTSKVVSAIVDATTPPANTSPVPSQNPPPLAMAIPGVKPKTDAAQAATTTPEESVQESVMQSNKVAEETPEDTQPTPVAQQEAEPTPVSTEESSHDPHDNHADLPEPEDGANHFTSAQPKQQEGIFTKSESVTAPVVSPPQPVTAPENTAITKEASGAILTKLKTKLADREKDLISKKEEEAQALSLAAKITNERKKLEGEITQFRAFVEQLHSMTNDNPDFLDTLYEVMATESK